MIPNIDKSESPSIILSTALSNLHTQKSDLDSSQTEETEGTTKLEDELGSKLVISDSRLSNESSIDTISKKYLLDPIKIRNVLSQGDDFYKFYFERKEKKYGKILGQAVSDYELILNNYEYDKRFRNRLISKKMKFTLYPFLTPRLLMKIIRHCHLTLDSVKNRSQHGAVVKFSKKIKWNLLTKKEGDTLHIIKWCGTIDIDKKHPQRLGRGQFSIVHRVINIASAEISSLKIAYSKNLETRKSAETLLKKEVEILSFIHRNHRINGIVKYDCFFDLSLKDDFLIAYTQKHFNLRDIYTAIKRKILKPELLKKKNGLEIMKTLFCALKVLHRETPQKGCIIQGDIKIENILIERGDDGYIRCALGDFGGSTFTKIKASELRTPPFGTTSTYGTFTYADYDLLHLSLDPDPTPEWVYYQKKRDIFALTAAIWELNAGQRPYLFDDEDFPITNKPPIAAILIEKKYGKKLTDILKKALLEDPANRPSTQQIIECIEDQLFQL